MSKCKTIIISTLLEPNTLKCQLDEGHVFDFRDLAKACIPFSPNVVVRTDRRKKKKKKKVLVAPSTGTLHRPRSRNAIVACLWGACSREVSLAFLFISIDAHFIHSVIPSSIRLISAIPKSK